MKNLSMWSWFWTRTITSCMCSLTARIAILPVFLRLMMKKEQLLGAYFNKNYEYIGKEFEGLSKHCACNTDEQKRTCQTVEQQKQVDLEEVNTVFPTFNKLIQELVMIQKLLSKKPWKENIACFLKEVHPASTSRFLICVLSFNFICFVYLIWFFWLSVALSILFNKSPI